MNSKRTAVFIGTKEGIDNAYSAETKAKLCERLEFIPGAFDKAYFEQKNADFGIFEKTEFIFSTWGMIAPDENSIKRIFPSLKAVFYAAGTVREFAVPFLNCGVKIFSAWAANAVPVAEFTVSQILLANKGYFQTVHHSTGSVWKEKENGKPYPGNFDTNIGIIGAGMIGTLVIKELVKHRLNIFVFDPFLNDEKASALGVEKVNDLPELFSKCRTVSNHLANNAQTVNMINKACFEKMPENGVFINTGRGQQVVEADLITALKKCPARVALLDVTYPEPPENGSELYTLPNVFLSPHIAGSLGSEVQRMGEYMCDEFSLYIDGEKTHYEVTREMLRTMA